MPRYFFHMATKDHQISDENGKQLKDLAAAHDHALHLIHRTMCSLREEQTAGWMIKVTPDSDGPSLTVLFPRFIPTAFRRATQLGLAGLLTPLVPRFICLM